MFPTLKPKVLRFACVAMLLLICSCSDDSTVATDDVVIDTTDDTVDDSTDDSTADPEGLNFSSVTTQVTLNPCNDSFCSLRQLIFLNEDVGYAVGGVDVYKTSDGGTAWEYMLNQDIVGPLIPLSEENMFINTYDGILKTTNAAASWTNIDRPLEFICTETGSINPGTIWFVDLEHGFIRDNCYQGKLYSTPDSGATWNLIYDSADSISEYYFEDQLQGLIVVNGLIYITSDGGLTWSESAVIPSDINYVIQQETQFLFPEGTAAVAKPDIITGSVSISRFAVNQNGDIVIITLDEAASEDQWKLLMYVNSDEPEWLEIDQLPDLEETNDWYTSIALTDLKTVFISSFYSGDVLKYFVD